MAETIDHSENLPARWDEELAKFAKKAAANERPTTTNLSVRGGDMVLNGVPVPNNELDTIIVASVYENQYYDPAKGFDPSNLQNPICFAQSIDGHDMAPHPRSEQHQALKCDACPQAQWGTSDGGRKRGKACKNKRKMALMPVASLETSEDIKKSELAILSIPVTSVKNWMDYVNYVANEHKRPPFGVMTTIKSSRHPKFQLIVEFGLKALVETRFIGDIMDRIAGAETLLMQPYEGTPDDPTQPTSNNKKQAKW